MAITPSQLHNSRIGLAIVSALMIGTFFIPTPAPNPLAAEPSGASSSTFEVSLGKGEEMTIYAMDTSITCSDFGIRGVGPGYSLPAGFLTSDRVIDGHTYYPVAGIAGTNWVRRTISCNTTSPLYATTVWITNASNVAIVRAGLIGLILIFGWYVIMGPLQRRRKPGSGRG